MNALKTNDSVQFGQAALHSPGFVPLAKVALTYAKMGITTVDEVLKLIEMVADEQARATESESEPEENNELEMTNIQPSQTVLPGGNAESGAASTSGTSRAQNIPTPSSGEFSFELEPRDNGPGSNNG